MWELLDHLTDGILLYRLSDPADDTSLVLQKHNRAAERLLGVDLTHADGKRLLEIFPYVPVSRLGLYADVARSGKDRDLGSVTSTNPVRTNDVYTVRAAAMSDRRVAVIFHNLTTLEQAARFLDAIVEHIPNMIFVKEAGELRFRRFNRAGEELLGVKREALLNKNDFDFFPEDQAKFFQARDRETLAAGKVVDIAEEPISTANGQRWLHTKKVPLLNDEGVAEYLLGISEDITERKAAAEKERALIAQLEASNAELDAFSYSVSHDLRSPLRAMHGFTQMLVEDYGDKLDAEGRRITTIITQSAVRMGQLIDDLLHFARLGRQSVAREKIDMTALSRSAVAELPTAGREIELLIDPLPSVLGDPALLKQVWLNVIGNAVKYTRDKAKAEVRISGDVRDNHAVYRVVDNGVGFDPRYATKLFGVFQRLHATDQYEGTGVGLALVKRIVQKHGGWVTCTAKPDEGATFEFGIPLGG